MKYIHQGSVVFKRGRLIRLDQLEFIFICPECEYVMTALKEEAIVTVRDTHIRICHPDELVPMRLDDAFGDLIRENPSLHPTPVFYREYNG